MSFSNFSFFTQLNFLDEILHTWFNKYCYDLFLLLSWGGEMRLEVVHRSLAVSHGYKGHVQTSAIALVLAHFSAFILQHSIYNHSNSAEVWTLSHSYLGTIIIDIVPKFECCHVYTSAAKVWSWTAIVVVFQVAVVPSTTSLIKTLLEETGLVQTSFKNCRYPNLLLSESSSLMALLWSWAVV